MKYVYDIECFNNFFCVTFKDVDTKEVIYYEINPYKENSIEDIYNFIKDNKKWFIGYNNYFYDNQILNYFYLQYNSLQIFDNKTICNKLFDISNKIIKNNLEEYKYNLPFKTIDLMEVGGLNLKSLKLCAVNLNWKLIQDLPFPPEYVVKEQDIEIIKKYNLNDVEITEKLYNFLLPEIKLRKEISQLYSINVMNKSDSHMANVLLEKFYSESTGIRIKDFKQLRTPRDIIHFKDVVFNNIKFQTDELNKFLSELKSFVLIKDKTYFKKTLIFRGLKLNLGMGGIHSDDLPNLFTETSDYSIIDGDIGSMYPTLLINHQLCPAHLSTSFIKKYEEIRDERLVAKKNKEVAKAEGLKCVLNSTWGKYNNEHFWLYDPLQAFRITVNGQLYIMTLIEDLIINGFEVISCNTDGVTTKVLKTREEEYYNICKKWSINNRFELEFNYYNLYARKDVNNYICQYRDGKLKEKGDFITTNLTKTNNTKLKGVDKKIIAIALNNYFINNIPIKETITNHTNIYDFCVAQKIDDKFTNEYYYIKEGKEYTDILQKTVRYYISKSGGTLYKTDKTTGKKIAYCVNRKQTIFNSYIEYKDFNTYDIDYGYYISETQKIIDLIINPQLSLF